MDWLNILKSLLLYSSLSSFRPHPFCSFGSSLYLFSPEAFHFLYVWTTHDNFQRIIIDSWTTPIAPSPPMSILMQKLKWLKGALHSWNISTLAILIIILIIRKLNLKKFRLYCPIQALLKLNLIRRLLLIMSLMLLFLERTCL